MLSPVRKSENQQEESVDITSVQKISGAFVDKRPEATTQRKLQEKADIFSQASLLPIQRLAMSGAVIQRNEAKDKLVAKFTKIFEHARKLERQQRQKGNVLDSDLQHLDDVAKKASVCRIRAEGIPDDNNADAISEINESFKGWIGYLGSSAWPYFLALYKETTAREEAEAKALADAQAEEARVRAEAQAKRTRLHALKQTNDAAIIAIRDQVIAWRQQYPRRNGINAGNNAGIGRTAGGTDNPLVLSKGLESDDFRLTQVASNVTDSDSGIAKVRFANEIFVHVT